MKFMIKEKQPYLSCNLKYYDHSFDTGLNPESVGVTILINYISLDVNEEGIVLAVWGYCPLAQTVPITVYPKNFNQKTLQISSPDLPSPPGVSYRYNRENWWEIYKNDKDGWVCLGDPQLNKYTFIEFLPNCIAGLEGTALKSLWLKPTFENEKEP